MWTREAIEAHVDALAGKPGFVDAVKAFADGLSEGERETLGKVLLARAGTVEYALMERVEARGWLRRQWDKASRRP